MKNWAVPLILCSALALGACHKKDAAESANATDAVQIDAAASVGDAANTAPTDTATPAPFDMSKVAVSNAPLGAFPYLSLPAGYKAGSESTLDVAQFPVWLGDRFQMVEGKVYQASIDTDDNKQFSKFELQKNIEALVQQAGGVQITNSKIPSAETDKLDQDVKQALNTGLGDIYNNKVETFLIHRADKDVWVHFTANSVDGNWSIIEAQPFKATATLLPPGNSQ